MRRAPSPASVSYTHLDVYKRQDQQQRSAEHGQTPLSGERGHQEEQRDKHRDPGKNLLAGNGRVHAGVGRSGETPVVVRERGIAIEPEADTCLLYTSRCV